MTFLWPDALWALMLLPVLILLYISILRRKKQAALRYANLSLVREALGAGSAIRRHIPPVLLLIALAALLFALARPTGLVTIPSHHETVILAIDVSGSMRATDVSPNRLVAAQQAAKAFIADQPSSVRIGIVSFAATAAVVQPPTRNREDLYAAIDRFQLQRGTATGSGIIVALATLFPDAGIDIGALTYGQDSVRARPIDRWRGAPEPPPFEPVPPGSNTSAAILLLTDGQRTTGPDPLQAARMAAERGVRVYTVGIGTTSGETIGFEGWSMRVRLDEDALKRIADITHGEYFHAGTATELTKVYRSLSSRFVLETKQTEITALFAAAGALCLMLSALLSLAWFNRIL